MPTAEYCTTDDGVRIAYCVEGDGPPLLFVHFVYAFSLSHLVPTFDQAIHRIGRGRRLIRYDIRGTGLSQRNVDDLSPAATILDLEAVLRALRLDRVTLLGAAWGGPRVIEYAARQPDRVAGLVLYETLARVSDVFPLPVLQAIAQLARANWQLATRTMVDAGVRRQDEQEGLRWAQMLYDSIAGDTMARLIEAQASWDATHLLPNIQCPTLVCHSRNDRLFPFAHGQRMAELIPGARLIPLEGDSGGPFTNAQSAIDAMDRFLPHPLSVTASTQREAERPLTPREVEILQLIAAGLTSKEIARRLGLSVRTIGRHITNLYEKIGARTRAEATSYALRHRLIAE